MNEMLEQRISSVQMGKNITYANIVAKHNLREQLNRDLEEFLEKGAEVKILPRGFSHFPNGIIPQCTGNAKRNEQDRIEREKLIEAKNQEIRNYKAAYKEQRRLESKQKKDVQMKEQIDVLGRFVKQFPTRGDFKQLSNLSGYQTRHLRDAAKGYTRLASARWDLIKKVIKNFKAESMA